MSIYRNAQHLGGPERDWRPGQPSTPEQYRARLIKRFWAKVDKTPGLGPKGDCWEWRGSSFKGYGTFGVMIDGKPIPRRSHAIAWEIIYAHGPVPKGWHVCHKCNNKCCVREEHLFAGTPRQNVHHAQATGLMPSKKPKPATDPASHVLIPSNHQRQLLRTARHQKGVGFMWLSRALDIHYSHLSRLETGTSVRGLRADKMICLLRLLEINEDEFRLSECKIGHRSPKMTRPTKYRRENERILNRRVAGGTARARPVPRWLAKAAPSNDLYAASEFKSALETSDLTLLEAAKALNVSPPTVKRLLRGEDVNVSNLRAMERFVESVKQQKAA